MITKTNQKIHKKRIKGILFVLISLAAAGLLLIAAVNVFVRSSVRKRIISSEEALKLDKVDCILILGAGIWENNKPSQMLEDRLKLGIKLYQAGAADKLLMSGDHGKKDYNEVGVMKQYAITAGVPSEDIFMDHAGFSTYESLYRARDIFQAHKVIVVTQKYHMYRALYIGKGLGMEVYGVASDPREYAGQYKRQLREIVARGKDFFYVITKPRPKYLGDIIPVNGNGNVTND
jgi:Uncharacterized membrane protein